MKGPLTIEQQMTILGKIWGNDRDGFVFLPWIPGKASDKAERRKGYHEGPAFEWPVDRDKIAAWLQAHVNDEVYFTPSLFLMKRRNENAADVERSLWADLDEADPRILDGNADYRPTIAWESSPGRFQAVWLLSDGRMGLSWPGDINHRLTMHLGADPSGWDTTQLLRVPGRMNYKPEYRAANGGRGVQGELLWDNGPRYGVDDFTALPELTVADTSDVDLMDAEIIDGIDRHDVWARVRLKMPMRIREYMGFRKASQITEDMDRSEIAWQIGKELVKAGCTVAEVIAVIRPTLWNSYSGRGDELKRLKIMASRAAASARDESDDETDDAGALEIIDEEKPEIRWLSDVMSTRLRRPRWLITNVWSDGGCGFISGDPKSYKSWTALDMAVSVATGVPFLGDPQFAIAGGPRPVLYIQEEDNEIVVRDRLSTVVDGRVPWLHWDGIISCTNGVVSWDPPEASIPLGFHVRTGFVASDPGWQMWLADIIQTAGIGHVIIDTLGTTAGDVDTDRAQDLMLKILKPMRLISHETGAGITVVHHNRKGSTNGTDRGGAKMLGSVALHAWVDDAMYIRDREQVRTGATKVRIERESKAATEYRWTLEVPRMGVNGETGVMTAWEPVVGIWDTSEDEPVTDQPSTPRGPRTNTVKRGTKAWFALKRHGAREHRPIPIERLAGVEGMTVAACWRLVQQGIESGIIGGTREGGVWHIGDAP